jgi:hypothetical protein
MQSNWRPWNDFWLKWSYKSRSILWVIYLIARIWYRIYGILIHTMYMIWIQLRVVYIFWSKLVVKATINTISIIRDGHGLLLEEKEYLDKTTWPAEVMALWINFLFGTIFFRVITLHFIRRVRIGESSEIWLSDVLIHNVLNRFFTKLMQLLNNGKVFHWMNWNLYI